MRTGSDQPKHDAVQKCLQVASRIDDEMNKHRVVAHLINDPALAGERLSEVVFDEALKLDGQMSALGEFADVCSVLPNLVDADGRGPQNAICKQRGQHRRSFS